jgi:hypothetical protein
MLPDPLAFLSLKKAGDGESCFASLCRDESEMQELGISVLRGKLFTRREILRCAQNDCRKAVQRDLLENPLLESLRLASN